MTSETPVTQGWGVLAAWWRGGLGLVAAGGGCRGVILMDLVSDWLRLQQVNPRPGPGRSITTILHTNSRHPHRAPQLPLGPAPSNCDADIPNIQRRCLLLPSSRRKNQLVLSRFKNLDTMTPVQKTFTDGQICLQICLVEILQTGSVCVKTHTVRSPLHVFLFIMMRKSYNNSSAL